MKKKIDLEQIFLSGLGSNQRLKWYLQYDVNIVDYLESQWPKYMALVDITIVMIPKDKIREFANGFSSARILGILEKERPDLFKTINNAKGIKWMEKQIENFRQRFL